MAVSNRFKANRKNKGTMTFAISDRTWNALKILCDFHDASPGEIISALVENAAETYEYFDKKETKETGE